MARKKKRRRRRKDKSLSLLTVGGLLSNVFKQAYAGNSIYDDLARGDISGAMYDAREVFLGIDANGKFQPRWFLDTWARPIIGFIMSKVMTKIGINREMKKIPFIGKYIKL